MDGFARRKEQSKEDIRKAAWMLFSQFGVDRVSIADIARKAGVSQATIYNNFGSKEALVREFVTSAVDQLIGRVHAILTPKALYRDKMAEFFQFITDMVANENPAASDRAFFSRSLDLQNDPEIKKIRMAAQEKMSSLLLELILEGMQQGQVNPGLSEEALRIYFAAFMEVFIDPELQQRFYHHPELIRELGSLMIDGLSGEHK
jgi:AcrR family transcriptional regulator